MKTKPTQIFIALCVAAIALFGAYLMYAKHHSGDFARAVQSPALPVAQTMSRDPQPLQSGPASAQASPAPAAPRVFYRHTGVDSHYGMVAWTETSRTHDAHFVESLHCEVVYVAGGRGICLSADRGVFTTYAASLFDARTFAVSGTFPLNGIPSRARVSIDGSLAVFTVFLTGHSYSSLDFSTQTILVDTRSAAALADLDDFEVRRDGAVIKAADFNFWGVTFNPDAKQFYATLSTAGQHFLVRGDIDARRAEVIHENVECPSLSPDARHIAYKKRLLIDNRIVWQLQVLELASQRETALSERRSIDDQLEWLDDAHVLYSLPNAADGSRPATNIWVAPIDASSAPRLFLENAYSPSVQRCRDPAACAAAGGSN